MSENKYHLYKEVRNKEDYFKSWDSERLKTLTQGIMDRVYAKYLIKCEVFARDAYTCQNAKCITGEPLTVHHFKHKRNGGKDTARNLVTLCDPCHKFLNKGGSITYKDSEKLPAHIRGQTQKINSGINEINWKQVRAEMKALRKKLSYDGVISGDIEWGVLCDLFEWLLTPYEEDDYDSI